MVIFSIFPIFDQIEYIMVSILSWLYSILLKSIIFLKKTFAKICLNFLRVVGGRIFFIHVTISYATITLGEGGVSPNLINKINFTVYFYCRLPLGKGSIFFSSPPWLHRHILRWKIHVKAKITHVATIIAHVAAKSGIWGGKNLLV